MKINTTLHTIVNTKKKQQQQKIIKVFGTVQDVFRFGMPLSLLDLHKL